MATTQDQTTQGNQTPETQNTTQTPPEIDYDKIQKMLDGTLKAKENTALKQYFKEQGLSSDEMTQAIELFKQQKAVNTPDFAALNGKLEQANLALQKAQVENAATLAALELGVDMKTVPYLIKMADLSKSIGQDGGINNDAITEALNKVLEDVPSLKPSVENTNTGFTQIGAGGKGVAEGQKQAKQKAVPTKRWNRWN